MPKINSKFLRLKIFENDSKKIEESEIEKDSTLQELIFLLNKSVDNYYLFFKLGELDEPLPLNVALDKILKDGDAIMISTIA
jgi:hypothetical protein